MSESEEEIGVARFPWITFASGMSESESEEHSVTASSYPSLLHRVAPNSLPGGLI